MRLIEAGRLDIVIPAGVARERLDPRTPEPRSPLRGRILEANLRRAPSAARQIVRIRVRAILRGDAAFERHAADADHLCEAAWAGCAYFVTRDRRLLRKRRDLDAALMPLRVIGLRELLDLYAGFAGAAEG